MNFFMLLVSFVAISSLDVFARKVDMSGCSDGTKSKIIPSAELITIIEKNISKAHYTSATEDLTNAYMIASVHRTFRVCLSKDGAKWGNFGDTENKIIFWWGEIVEDKSYLQKALKLVLEHKKHIQFYKLKLGWIYERLEESKKAFKFYEETYQVESVKFDKNPCKTSDCPQLNSVLYALERMVVILRKVPNIEILSNGHKYWKRRGEMNIDWVAHHRRWPCRNSKKYDAEDLIAKVKEVSKVNPYPGIYHDLTTAYLIGSVHKQIMICEPLVDGSKPQWGEFPIIRGDRIIWWEGKIIRKDFLHEALKLLTATYDVNERKWHLYNDFRLGWVYEMMGNYSKAYSLYEKTYWEESKKVDASSYCKDWQCPSLNATIEAVDAISRLEKRKSDERSKKILKLQQLIAKYRPKVIYNHRNAGWCGASEEWDERYGSDN